MGLVTILQFNLDDNYLTEGTVVYSSGKDGHPVFIKHVVSGHVEWKLQTNLF